MDTAGSKGDKARVGPYDGPGSGAEDLPEAEDLMSVLAEDGSITDIPNEPIPKDLSDIVFDIAEIAKDSGEPAPLIQDDTTKNPYKNPKDGPGAKKVPMSLIPPSAKIHMAMAFKDGAKKYGPYNWRDHKVVMSIYLDACQRHLDSFFDGETHAKDSGLHHLGHAMACLAIVLDAQECGNIIDDRPTAGCASKLHEEFREK